jgi:hypothetical protein
MIVGPYTLIKYPPDKKNDPLYRNQRSVIYKGDTLVCMSPGKSVPLDETIPLSDYIVEDFVEGIMINAFYDDGWHIATKSNIGANCTFDSNRTFSELFEDCKQAMGLSLDALNPEFSYSFVMQHPDHRIVTPVTKPTLKCVARFKGEKEFLSDLFPPTRYRFSSWEEAKDVAQKGLCKGLVFKYKGLRSKIRNAMHHSMEGLKQNVPFPERYVKLRNKPDLKEYLFYFPEERDKADALEIKIQEVTSLLFTTYRECFMLKKQKAKDHSLKSALYDLHTIYLQELYPRSLSKKRVEEYVCKHIFHWKEYENKKDIEAGAKHVEGSNDSVG